MSNIIELKGSIIRRHSKMAAGYDLKSAQAMTIPGRGIAAIPTGVSLNMSQFPNMMAMLALRSSLAVKHGIMLANGVGIIDADYQGEIQVVLYNTLSVPTLIPEGVRIAQLVFLQIETPKIAWVSEFNTITERAEGGFGSSGV